MSIFEKLKILDEQRSKLLEGAKSEALELARKAVATLKELGFHYSLVEGAPAPSTRPPRATKAETQPKRQQRDIACPICGFKTSPLHDRRAHRSQEPKKPFTTAELAEKGLKQVG